MALEFSSSLVLAGSTSSTTRLDRPGSLMRYNSRCTVSSLRGSLTLRRSGHPTITWRRETGSVRRRTRRRWPRRWRTFASRWRSSLRRGNTRPVLGHYVAIATSWRYARRAGHSSNLTLPRWSKKHPSSRGSQQPSSVPPRRPDLRHISLIREVQCQFALPSPWLCNYFVGQSVLRLVVM